MDSSKMLKDKTLKTALDTGFEGIRDKRGWLARFFLNA
jgi:hypothetical protein